MPKLTSALTNLATLKEKNQWVLEEKAGLPLLFSPLLLDLPWLRHAFTTRKGAQSEAPLEWFNLARHWETAESKVDALNNRRILCKALDIDPDKLSVPSQQHTNNVVWIDEENCTSVNYDGVDALATETPGRSLLLHFADCVPIMMADKQKRSIAVIHAGWRGTAAGIVKEAINALCEHGSAARDIVVAIGPAIGDCCFQTGPDVAEKLISTVKHGDGLIQWKEVRPYPDLKAINALQAYEAGAASVDVSHWCTACHPEIFYSHRQSGGKTGRQGAIACILD